MWIRWFENVMAAANVTDGAHKKTQLLAMGGMELQCAYYSLPGVDDETTEANDPDPYLTTKDKLMHHFSPKQHDSFERFLFWSIVSEDEEPIEKFALRVQQKAEKICFGKTALESRHIAVIDKIIQYTSNDLRQKLLEKEILTLDDTTKIINAFQAVRYQSAKMNDKGPGNRTPTAVNRITRPNIPYKESENLPTFSVNRIAKMNGSIDERTKCSRCGYLPHRPGARCPAATETCHGCGIVGHFRTMCRSKSKHDWDNRRNNRKRKLNLVTSNEHHRSEKRTRNVFNVREHEGEEIPEDLPVYNVGCSDDEIIHCRVGGVQIGMLIDSGSKHNLIDDTTWELMKLRDVKMTNQRVDTDKRFLAYGRIPLKLITTFDAELEVDDSGNLLKTKTSFYVIEKGQQPLLGKLTAQKLGLLKIGLPSTHSLSVRKIESSKAFPKIKGIKLNIPIDRTVPAVIQPLRRCPIPLLEKVEQKLNELLEMDVIEKVKTPTSWVSPLVPIIKENGDLRLCVDMRRANQAIQRLNHPLPVFEDLISRFRNAKFFTSLDIKQAFHQVELSEDSRDVTTFITNWGLYRYKRLLFGINCAPELFQNLMESILVGCKNTVVFIDDIMIFGETEQEHDSAVKLTLQVLSQYGILLNDHKCKFKQQEIVFLGHKLSANGVSPCEEKVKAILSCRAPRTKEELRSFLGLVTYVSRFIPNLATINYPLRQLLRQESHFEWMAQHKISFEKIKTLIGSAGSLGFYDRNDRTLVVTDASGVGLGAVLIQFKNSLPRIISFASKSLSEVEKTYPPIEKEALGVVWAVERFKNYLLGITFELETDHRPLETLFTTTSRPTARIERWLLRIQAFRFKVVYRKGSANLADCLSRLAAHVEDPHWTEETDVFIRRVMVQSLSFLSGVVNELSFDSETEEIIRALQQAVAIDIEEVATATVSDQELQKVIKAIETDKWDQEDLKQYKPFRLEFSNINNLVMRGTKLVIPISLRSRMCELAHEGHPGQSMMKRRLRERCWWPGIDQTAVKICERCEGCQLVQSSNPPEPMTRRALPEKPWVDIAMDFLGPMPSGEYLLVVIDYYSRYIEIQRVLFDLSYSPQPHFAILAASKRRSRETKSIPP
ncbi:uncharacterized protein K02A2.6-like [Wyeomyia smithii]|uniref:uncharacterized protein K02A2.6-like n=1 Tax=Wyeomyia smithii TaxID=174621 RepID=UPI0024680316|nr:uncharacterized protein K02A2.6-like [Wyeomyia smithii]